MNGEGEEGKHFTLQDYAMLVNYDTLLLPEHVHYFTNHASHTHTKLYLPYIFLLTFFTYAAPSLHMENTQPYNIQRHKQKPLWRVRKTLVDQQFKRSL